jgi:hypothetical protein
MIDIKQTLADKQTLLPELINTTIRDRINAALNNPPKASSEFDILSDLVSMKLDLRRLWIELHSASESKNSAVNDIINKLKLEIETAEDYDGKKIYTNDTKRKIELDLRIASEHQLIMLYASINATKLLLTELDLAESVIRSYSNFLEKK